MGSAQRTATTGTLQWSAHHLEGPMRYHGSCHCSRKGYLLWFVPREPLTLATPEQDMATYTFNKHVIEHRFCPNCGCAPFGLGNAPDGQAMAAINVRCLEGVELAELKRVPVDGRNF